MSRARRQLEEELRRLLREVGDDRELRDRLEAIANELPFFGGFTWLWGPVLYRRNRVLFRPFILNRFATYYLDSVKPPKVEHVPWKGEVARSLEAWLGEVETKDDVPLFRKLIQWRASVVSWRKRSGSLRGELMRRFRKAADEAERRQVIRRFDFPFELDEAAALELYQGEPGCGPFLLRHLPWSLWWGGEPRAELWSGVMKLALERGYSAFGWELYRQQVPVKVWEKDALEDCRRIQEADALAESLERRHPRQRWTNLGATLVQMLELRGEAVIPYVGRHLADVFGSWCGKGEAGKLALLARRRGWTGLWAATVRTCFEAKEYNAEVRGVLEDGKMPVDEQRLRLELLAGVSREWNFGPVGVARVLPLSEKVAMRMLERYPELLRGPYRVHLQASPWGERYGWLIEALMVAGEEALLDFVASRLVTWGEWAVQKKGTAELERLAGHYESLLAKPAEFARRAAAVLGHVPAYAIGVHAYPGLLRLNPLARLFFERAPAAYLADPRSVGDLVEGSEIHVMALGYRVLALPDPRARELARRHVDLLLGTLLRSLHRITRALAFGALENAGSDAATAARIVARAREAFALPDERYPKDALLRLVGTLLDRWPELRRGTERPLVYRRSAAGEEAAA